MKTNLKETEYGGLKLIKMAECRIELPVLVSAIMKVQASQITGNVLASLHGIRCGSKSHSLHNY